MTSRTFPRNEHLKSRKQIQALFHTGKAFSVFPLKIGYLLTPSPAAGIARAGFSAPSRHFKSAVDRNRIKRQMREAYRLQKEELAAFLQDNRLELSVFFIFVDRKLPDYPFLYKKMGVSLKRLLQNMAQAIQENENTQ